MDYQEPDVRFKDQTQEWRDSDGRDTDTAPAYAVVTCPVASAHSRASTNSPPDAGRCTTTSTGIVSTGDDAGLFPPLAEAMPATSFADQSSVLLASHVVPIEDVERLQRRIAEQQREIRDLRNMRHQPAVGLSGGGSELSPLSSLRDRCFFLLLPVDGSILSRRRFSGFVLLVLLVILSCGLAATAIVVWKKQHSIIMVVPPVNSNTMQPATGLRPTQTAPTQTPTKTTSTSIPVATILASSRTMQPTTVLRPTSAAPAPTSTIDSTASPISDQTCDGFPIATTTRIERIDVNTLPTATNRVILPDCIGKLTGLTHLELRTDQFEGSIPTSIGDLTQLTSLILRSTLGESSRNNNNSSMLTGTIPTVLASLTKLRVLNVAGQRFTGTLPTAWFQHLTELKAFSWQGNHLSGSIPTALGSLLYLQHLDLHGNDELSGSFPTEIGLLTELTNLNFGGSPSSGLIGVLPTELGLLTHLRVLNLWVNRLVGTIPTELSQCTALEKLLLGRNQLTGTIPTEFGVLHANLAEFLARKNQLTGTIPTELGQLTSLTRLWLNSNQLTGAVPTWLDRISGCRAEPCLDMSDNNFSEPPRGNTTSEVVLSSP